MSKESICRHFFKVSEKEDYWDCRFCSKDKGKSIKSLKQKKGTGWSNLYSHILCVHKDYENIMKDKMHQSFTYPAKVKSMYCWIELMVMKNLPLSLVDDELFRKAISYNSVSSNSLKKYMDLLCRQIENDMRTLLPMRFGIIFDGWSEGNDHYVALFACHSALYRLCFFYSEHFEVIIQLLALFTTFT